MAQDLDGFVDMAADLSVGRVPERPFMLFGQMTTSDPSRSPAGTADSMKSDTACRPAVRGPVAVPA